MRGIEGPKTSVSRSPTDEFGCVTLSPRAKFTTNFKFSWSSGHAATSHHSTLESRRLQSDGNVGEHTDFICSWYFCY
jgi:hypothetical protein